MNVTFEDIQAAQRLMENRVLRTPCFPSCRLSELTGANVILKLENLQHTGAFKVRGALNKLMSLTEDERKAGVIAASAGNHAQGVGYFARLLDIPATIVMPTTSSRPAITPILCLNNTVTPSCTRTTTPT